MARSFLKVAFTSCTLLCVLGARPELAENEVEASTEKEVHAHQHSASVPPGALAEISEVTNETVMACDSFCVTCGDGFKLFINRGQSTQDLIFKAAVAGAAGGLLIATGGTGAGVAAGVAVLFVAKNAGEAHMKKDEAIEIEKVKDSCKETYVLWGEDELYQEKLPKYSEKQPEGIWMKNQDKLWCLEHRKQTSCIFGTTALGTRAEGRLADATEKVLKFSKLYCDGHGGYDGETKDKVETFSGTSFLLTDLQSKLKQCVKKNSKTDIEKHRSELDKLAALAKEAALKKHEEENKKKNN